MEYTAQTANTSPIDTPGTTLALATTHDPHTQAWITGVVDMPKGIPFMNENLKYTYTSYRRDDIPELDSLLDSSPTTTNSSEDGFQSWALCIPISIPPDLPNPTLEFITYDIRYTSFKAGNVFVQTDIIMSNGGGGGGDQVVEGIITDSTKLTLYSHYDNEETRRSEGYTPPTLDRTICTCISSRPSFKGPDISGWCDFIDHHEIYPDTRIDAITQDDAYMPHTRRLYLFFHVYQGACGEALRNIDVDITAAWSDGDELRNSVEKAKGLDEIRKERGRLVVMQKKTELMTKRLEERIGKAVEESEAREKEMKDLEGKLLVRGKGIKDWEEKLLLRGNGMKDWEEKLLAVEERVNEVERVRAQGETSGWANRGNASQVRAENVTAMVLGVVQKFREEVKRREREDGDRSEQAEAADRERRKDLAKIQKEFREELDQCRREGATNGERMEVENKVRVEAEKRLREEIRQFRREEAARMETEIKERKKFYEEVEKFRREEAKNRARMEAEKEERERFYEEIEKFRREAAENKAQLEADREEWEQKLEQMIRDGQEKERLERRKARERKAEEEEERIAREEEIRIAKEEMERMRSEEMKRKDRGETDRKGWKEAEASGSFPKAFNEAPGIAGGVLAERIKQVVESWGKKCPDGYEWEKNTWGYQCRSYGPGHYGHWSYWEDLISTGQRS